MNFCHLLLAGQKDVKTLVVSTQQPTTTAPEPPTTTTPQPTTTTAAPTTTNTTPPPTTTPQPTTTKARAAVHKVRDAGERHQPQSRAPVFQTCMQRMDGCMLVEGVAYFAWITAMSICAAGPFAAGRHLACVLTNSSSSSLYTSLRDAVTPLRRVITNQNCNPDPSTILRWRPLDQQTGARSH